MRFLRASTFVLVVLACGGCGRETGLPDENATSLALLEPHAAMAAAQTSRCVACHALDGPAASAFAPLPRIPLRDATGWHSGGALVEFLKSHHAGEDADAIAAMLRGGTAEALRPATVAADATSRGERMFGELGCVACHAESSMASLAARTDHAHVVAFLKEPSARRPDLAHDFALSPSEATDLAAFLLRAQAPNRDDAPAQGLDWECFEIDLVGDELPSLDGVVPKAKGATDHVDVSLRTRNDHFALRFSGLLLVPEAGDWTFTLGSDDSSWLWIDDALVVENAKVAPHRRKSATVRLDAGARRLRIVFTELAGQESLELLWRGPSIEESPVPSSAFARKALSLVPTASVMPRVDAQSIARGETAFLARNCAACHEHVGAAPPRKAAPWAQLRAGRCVVATDGEAVFAAARESSRIEPAPDIALRAAMQARRCVSCHERNGSGGIDAAVRARFVEVEDIGEEGRVPPDLSRAGHRLRKDWLRLLLVGERRARGYLKARMPRLPEDLATSFAELFERVDARPGDDVEPAFDGEMAQRGQHLVGVNGRNCVTCHPFGGRRAIGPQGMDLALQHERLKPAWFADWLLHATALRPGTRMPAFWLRDDERAKAEVDAIRVWGSLGAAAPVPNGYRSVGDGMELDPLERPVLHGAFLKGLSARCVAVGSPLRGHYAYDVEHAQLAWLWRGSFIDAAGTWSGRAGQLLLPLSDDRVTLDPLPIRDATAASAIARNIGQRRTDDGHPTFRSRVGDCLFEDSIAPELTSRGVEFVRTIRCEQGALRVEAAAQSGVARVTIDGAPAGPRDLQAGQSLSLRYSW